MGLARAAAPMPHLLVYSAVGVLNSVADFCVFVLLTSGLHYHPVPANVVSYGTGILLSFVMNWSVTFRSHSYELDLGRQFVRFCAINLVSLGLSTAIVDLLWQWTTAPVAKLVSVPFVVVWGFLAVRAYVFASAAMGYRN